MIHVYVAGPYSQAANVRNIHRVLEHYGLVWTSRWAEEAAGPENLGAMPSELRERVRLENHRGIYEADVVLVLGEAPMCETLVEVGVAVARGVPIVWVEGGARMPLSATCPSLCTAVANVLEGVGAMLEITRRAA